MQRPRRHGWDGASAEPCPHWHSIRAGDVGAKTSWRLSHRHTTPEWAPGGEVVICTILSWRHADGGDGGLPALKPIRHPRSVSAASPGCPRCTGRAGLGKLGDLAGGVAKCALPPCAAAAAAMLFPNWSELRDDQAAPRRRLSRCPAAAGDKVLKRCCRGTGLRRPCRPPGPHTCAYGGSPASRVLRWSITTKNDVAAATPSPPSGRLIRRLLGTHCAVAAAAPANIVAMSTKSSLCCHTTRSYFSSKEPGQNGPALRCSYSESYCDAALLAVLAHALKTDGARHR